MTTTRFKFHVNSSVQRGTSAWRYFYRMFWSICRWHRVQRKSNIQRSKCKVIENCRHQFEKTASILTCSKQQLFIINLDLRTWLTSLHVRGSVITWYLLSTLFLLPFTPHPHYTPPSHLHIFCHRYCFSLLLTLESENVILTLSSSSPSYVSSNAALNVLIPSYNRFSVTFPSFFYIFYLRPPNKSIPVVCLIYKLLNSPKKILILIYEIIYKLFW